MQSCFAQVTHKLLARPEAERTPFPASMNQLSYVRMQSTPPPPTASGCYRFHGVHSLCCIVYREPSVLLCVSVLPWCVSVPRLVHRSSCTPFGESSTPSRPLAWNQTRVVAVVAAVVVVAEVAVVVVVASVVGHLLVLVAVLVLLLRCLLPTTLLKRRRRRRWLTTTRLPRAWPTTTKRRAVMHRRLLLTVSLVVMAARWTATVLALPSTPQRSRKRRQRQRLRKARLRTRLVEAVALQVWPVA